MKNIYNKFVLVIDDDTRMLRALEKVLSLEGAFVRCAEGAGEAIDILTGRNTPIDLVITDLRMPFISGLTAVYAIHKMFPKIPVIVLTAYGSPDVKAECFSQGAAAFLEKPLDMPQLLDVVENVLAVPEPVATASTSEESETDGHSPARKLKSESHPKEKERTPHEHNQ